MNLINKCGVIMVEKIKSLLEKSSAIIEEMKATNKDSRDEFNIFNITGFASDEVKVCRMLAEILNPDGKHGCSAMFLESFIKSVLGLDFEPQELDEAWVYTECHTEQDRRIDIVIETAKRFIPIEVKLYALDQQGQCKHYYEYANSMGKPIKSLVYYLTLDGHLPHGDGCKGLTPLPDEEGYEELIPLSFKNDICSWLEEVMKMPMVLSSNTLTVNIGQFKYFLEEITGNMSREEKEKYSEIISENSKTFEAACAIAENIETAKENMLYKLFDALDNAMKTFAMEGDRLTNEFDYKYNDYEAIKRFYQRGKTYPALTYRYKTIDENKEAWLRIEVDHRLFFGFVLAENDENPGKLVLPDEEIKKQMNMDRLYKDGWWFYWEYLSVDDEDKSPNFVYPNDTLIKLFDQEYFDKFISDCVKRIGKFID